MPRMVSVTVTGSPAATSSGAAFTSKSKLPTAPEKSAGLPASGSGSTVSGQRVGRDLEPALLAAEERIVEEAAAAAAAAHDHREPHLGRADRHGAAPERRQDGREVEHLERAVGGLLLALIGLGELVDREAVAADRRVLDVADAHAGRP